MFNIGFRKRGFTDHLAFQDVVVAGARPPARTQRVIVREELELQFRRGLATSTFTVALAEGPYEPVLDTDEGSFHLAPWEGFLYQMGDEPHSLIGGIFLRRSDQKPFVWFIPRQGPEEEWNAWLKGARIAGVQPGLKHVAVRPWVEQDFVVPVEKIGVEGIIV